MRTRFHGQLDELGLRLVLMCELDRAAIETATTALLDADLVSAERAIDLSMQVRDMARPVEDMASKILATQSPVASDLRKIVTALQLIGDLDRMAVLVRHIAESARRRHPDPAPQQSLIGLFGEMGKAAVALADGATEVLTQLDPERAALLDDDDEHLDTLHREMLELLVGPDWTGSVAEAVDATLLARYFERFGDHAVTVGRRTIYLATGEGQPSPRTSPCET